MGAPTRAGVAMIHPAGILAVFGILLFGGMYFFNVAMRIIKEVI